MKEPSHRRLHTFSPVCFSGNDQTIGIERSEIAWGLGRGLTAEGHEDILGDDGDLSVS